MKPHVRREANEGGLPKVIPDAAVEGIHFDGEAVWQSERHHGTERVALGF